MDDTGDAVDFDSPPPRDRRWVFAAAVTVVLAMAVVALLLLWRPFSDSRPPVSTLAAIGISGVVAYPALVALAVRDRCPRLLIAGGISCIPRMFLSFSILFFPLIIPAVLFFMLSGGPCSHRRLRHLLANLAVVALGLAAIAALFLTRDPVSYDLPGAGYGYTSDTISSVEAALSLAITASGVAAGWMLSSPRSTRAGARHRS